MSEPSPRFPRLALYTWQRQWPSEVCKGAVEGISGLAGFVALRTLGAPEWVSVLIAIAGQILWVFAPGLEAFTSRLDHRKAILWLGVAANVPLLLIAFVPPDAVGSIRVLGTELHWWVPFVAAIIVLTALDAFYIPLRGALLRANYADSVRGRFFSALSAVSKAGSMLSSKAAGWMLHHDPALLRVVFPLAGVFGLAEHIQLARIRWHHTETPVRDRESGFTQFLSSLREGWRILRTDRDFRTYEIGFTLYGLGFLMSQPMFSIFAERDLRLSYDEVTWAQGVTEPVAYLAVALLLGPRIPKLGIVPVTALSFLSLSIFFIALAHVTAPWQYVALWGLFGATMAAVNLGWNLGPIRFAPPGKARAYAAVHVCVVGLRIIVGPALGYGIARLSGGAATDVRLVFGISCVVVAAGCVVTARLARRVR